ncbi:MAG: glycosyltransferase [Ignavibacteriales bacterium]|nr:glycosyltransferase [Ignavibacteriales bacterium]
MNIFQFSFGDGYAGSSKVALISSKILIQNGNNVQLFVSKDSLTEKRAIELKIPTYAFDTDKKFKNLMSKIYRIFDQFNPIVVISHHSIDRKIGIELKKKYKSSFINVGYRHNISKTFPIIGAFLYNRYFDNLLACSQGVADSLTQSGIKVEKVKVIRNSITIPKDLNTKTGRAIKDQYNLNNKVVLGMSTWFHKERKGFDILFNAFKELDDRFILLLIGIPENDKQKVFDFASEFKISADKIIMPGYVENVWDYYKAMDIFLLTSRSEGFSLALLEAAAAHLPIIASDIAGNNEFITHGKNGLLFNTSNPDELKEAIIKFVNDKLLSQKLSQNAYTVVMENYQLENYTDSLTKFIKLITT